MECSEKEETVRIGSLPRAADCCAKSRSVSFFFCGRKDTHFLFWLFSAGMKKELHIGKISDAQSLEME